VSLGRATWIAALCAGALALAPCQAGAAVSCGDMLTKDAKLKADLDCAGTGAGALGIGANGVTLDLNGHKVIGAASSQYGIDGSSGFNKTVIKDGTFEGFYHAIELAGFKHVTLSNLKIKLTGVNDDYGVYAGNGRDLEMRRIDVENPDYGFYLYGVKGFTLQNSSVLGDAPYSGVYTDGTGTIDDVKVRNAQYGFYLYTDGADDIEVAHSSSNNGSYAGFYLANADGRRDIKASHNTANGNADYGFYAGKKAPGHGNRARDNGTEDCHNVNCG
jgi:hypothetical protein